MGALTEIELIEAVRRGQREGQTEMVGRYAERVFAMVVRQVPDVMDAQELTQDTFLRAFSHIDSYDSNKASLSTWLCRIAYRITLDFLKRHRPVIVSIETDSGWQTDISDEQLESELSTGREERIQRLEKLINDEDNTTLHVRTHDDQEMWLMCCKNPENPQLRDAYAITWVLSSDKKIANGTVYMVTSLRPDVYEKNFESSKKMFKIVGRVGDEIKDSLYNIYIADSREALYNLEDHEYVACIPVINKRFEWQTEFTKPSVGRLRCIFPDGSLCSAWIDLDFVPGETYNITVHNGYYDEDKDYERCVGRQSGKSLIEPDAVKVVDEVPSEYQKANPVEDEFEKWYRSLSPAEEMQFQIKAERIRMSSEKLDELYKFIKTMLNGSNLDYQMDVTFKEILKQNKEIDTKWQDAIKFAQAQSLPKLAYPILYKEILEFLQVRTVKSMTSISVVLWSRTPVRCRSTSPNKRKST